MADRFDKDPNRCRNWTTPAGDRQSYRCQRARNPEKGDGKYCNVCHAAKLRGARAASDKAAKREARYDKADRFREARDRVLSAAIAWRWPERCEGVTTSEIARRLTDAVEAFEREKADPDGEADGD